MPDVIYTPPEGNPDFPPETTHFGYQFKAGEPVEVTDAEHLERFRGNRFFVIGETGQKAPQPAAVVAPSGTGKPTATGEQLKTAFESGLKAAQGGRPRTVYPAFHKLNGSPEAWLQGYDSHTA